MPIATGNPDHPHLPVPLGVLSEWQRTVRDHPLLNSRKDESLPEEADVVIVGSGMCGAVLANSLLKANNRPEKVVVLEAREVCSGASGRNAGHCRPDPYRGFTNFAALHGDQEARRICESESLVLKRVDAYIKEHGVECEWTPRKTYDACLTDDFSEYSAKALKGVRAAGSKEHVQVQSGQEAEEATRVESVVTSYGWPAATLNPAQLTLSIHTDNLSLGGYELYSWAPVRQVVEADQGRWKVMTSRGSVIADKVVFATNAYSQALIPELKDLLTPMRAQAVKLSPAPAGQEAFPPLEASYSLRFMLQHFYSVATRPDNSIILGTSRGWPGMPPEVYRSIVNCVDDSAPNDTITKNAFETFVKLFPQGGWSAGEETKGLEYAWTGIIGMTPDAVPFVGDVPGKKGQYVAAGYNGHGMARIFLCAPSLASYMLDGEWDPQMPVSFQMTPERIERLREKVGSMKDKRVDAESRLQPALERMTI